MDRKHGGDLEKQFIDFSININPLGIAEGIKDIIKEKISLADTYPDIYYADTLALVAKNYQVDQNHIFFCNGANEAIFPLLYSFRGEEVLISSPMFEEYHHYAKFLEIKVHHLSHLGVEEMTYIENVINYLKEHSKIKAFLMVNPNNPTGKVISKKALDYLYDFCEREKIHLIIDESFMDFLEEKEDYSLLSRVNDAHYLTLLKSLTKVYGIPGLRLGLCFTANEVVKMALRNILQPWNLSLPALLALEVIVKSNPSLKSTYQYLREERFRLETSLDKLKLKYEKSKVNFLLVYNGYNLYQYLKRKGILVRDCSNFVGLQNGDLRIGIQDKQKQDRLIECLEMYRRNEQ